MLDVSIKWYNIDEEYLSWEKLNNLLKDLSVLIIDKLLIFLFNQIDFGCSAKREYVIKERVRVRETRKIRRGKWQWWGWSIIRNRRYYFVINTEILYLWCVITNEKV